MSTDHSYHNSEEKQLLLLLSEGDHAAFRELMNRYYVRLFPFILNITKHYAVAEEMLQDVFMRLWEKRETMPQVMALRSWLFRVAANMALNWLKRAAAEGRIIQQLGVGQPSYSTLTQEQLSLREAETELQQAIDRLPSQQKIIFNLAHTGGLDHEQIAEKLKISPHTVRSHLGRALQSLRAALRNRKGFLWIFA